MDSDNDKRAFEIKTYKMNSRYKWKRYKHAIISLTTSSNTYPRKSPRNNMSGYVLALFQV